MMKYTITVFCLLMHCSLFAQFVEGIPCTSSYLDPNKNSITGTTPKANGVSPNKNLPCGNGETEDNPVWWSFRPKVNSVKFSFNTSNCIAGTCGLGIEMALWEGTNCGNVFRLDCTTGESGSLEHSVDPCKVYFLQIDGICESQCKVTLTYDKNSLMTAVDAPVINGPAKICRNSDATFTADLSTMPFCAVDSWIWSISPAGAGIVTKDSTNPAEMKLQVAKTYSGTKLQLCAKPKFNRNSPKTTPFCMDLLIENCVANDELLSKDLFNIFPNPADELLNIASPIEIQKIQLFNLQGQKVLEQAAKSNEMQVQIDVLPAGHYLLNIFSPDANSYVFKVKIK